MAPPASTRSKGSVRKAPAAYHHGDLARALVQASLEIMAEVGPEGLSLREAARKAGVNHRAVYRHYEDKRALLAAVAESGYRQLTAAAVAAVSEPTPAALSGAPHTRAALLAIAETFLRFAKAEPARYQVMFGPCLNRDARFPELEAAIQSTVKVLVDALAQAAPERSEVDRRDAGITFLAAIHGLTSLILAGRSMQDDEMMTLAGTRALFSLYAQAKVEVQRLEPAEHGVPAIGHFGFFRSKMKEPLWPLVSSWIERMSSAPAAAVS